MANKTGTRRVISETKVIMSAPICHWMETIGFIFTGRWDHKLELSQKVMNTLSTAAGERGETLTLTVHWSFSSIFNLQSIA